MTTAIDLCLRADDRLTSCVGRELSSSIAASTRPRVEAFTPAPSLRTAETVAFDTPACWATSVIVGRFVVIAARTAGEGVVRTDLNAFEQVRNHSGATTLQV